MGWVIFLVYYNRYVKNGVWFDSLDFIHLVYQTAICLSNKISKVPFFGFCRGGFDAITRLNTSPKKEFAKNGNI